MQKNQNLISMWVILAFAGLILVMVPVVGASDMEQLSQMMFDAGIFVSTVSIGMVSLLKSKT